MRARFRLVGAGAALGSATALVGRYARCDDAAERKHKFANPVKQIYRQDHEVQNWQILHLRDLGFPGKQVPNRRDIVSGQRENRMGGTYNKVIKETDCVLTKVVRDSTESMAVTQALPRAGPRANLHFEPREVKAAIVTCGGLCPGLNDVVKNIVDQLYETYGVTTVYGIRGGYRGLARGPEVWPGVRGGETDFFKPIKLTPEFVKDIHHLGGTVLGSSRGGMDEDKIIEFIQANGINQLYVVGGDGTHRGAYRISQACATAGIEIAVAGIPKTIDNDVGVVDKSFGFESAVEAAQLALRAGKVEAEGNMPNGVCVVKLMGRSAGYISAYATLSSGDVDLCLIPEVGIQLHGAEGCLPHLERVVAEKGHALVVVAEGAGEDLLGQSAEVDAGGNRKLPPIGDFMVKEIKNHFKSLGKEATVKYIDPSYMIRSVPANSHDSYECFVLSQGAVHGAMAGFTGFTVGLVNSHTVMIPIPLLVEKSPRKLNPAGRTWERVLSTTGQPNPAI